MYQFRTILEKQKVQFSRKKKKNEKLISTNKLMSQIEFEFLLLLNSNWFI